MNRFHFAVLSALAVLLFATTAYAITKKEPANRAEIRADQKAGTISFVIDGKTVALLNADGLHVRGNVSYGGAISDIDEAGFDDLLKQGGEATPHAP